MVPPTKRCGKCREFKPVSEFHINNTRPDRLKPTCKACIAAYYRANAKDIQLRAKTQRTNRTEYKPVSEKKCPGCGEIWPASGFYRDKRSTDGLTSRCKSCIKTRQDGYYATHKDARDAWKQRYKIEHSDRYRAGYRAYYHNNRERHLANNKSWRLRNRDKIYRSLREWRRRNPDRIRRYGKTSRERNPGIAIHGRHARRARKRGAEGSYTFRQWNALCEHFGNVCLRCGSSCSLTVDHVIPLSIGGSNGIENLQPLCKSCNSKKHAKVMDYRDPFRLIGFFTQLALSLAPVE